MVPDTNISEGEHERTRGKRLGKRWGEDVKLFRYECHSTRRSLHIYGSQRGQELKFSWCLLQ